LTHTAGTNFFQLHFDLRATNSFAEIVLNFNPGKNGSSIDLSKTSSLIFGLSSATVQKVKIEIEDTYGNTYSTSNTDIVAASYYKFLTSLAAGKVDLSHVQSITVGVDQDSVANVVSLPPPANLVGDLELEIGGLS